MIVTQRGVVDITPEYNRALRPVFCVSEGDKTSRQIILTVMQSGETFLIPIGATVYIVGKKPDNNIFTYRCSYSGSEVRFNITDQMSAASGIVLCELQINLNGEVLGSANFVYWTEPTPLENGSYSESDLNIFLEAIAGAERLDNFYAGIEDMVAQAVEQIQIKPGQVVIDPTLLVNGAAADAAATGNAVRSFLEALVTETTPTAAIATCDDAAGGLPLKKLTAQIEPTQSGTGDPSPDNVRPISGYTAVNVVRTGNNLVKPTFEYAPMRMPDDRTITFSCKENADGTSRPQIYFYDKDYNVLTNFTILAGQRSRTVTFSRDYPIVYCRLGNGTISGDLGGGEWMLNYGAEALPYEEYGGASYPVTFPTEAGTVYGGTLTVNSDGSGTLTVDRAEIASYAGETLPGEWISDRDVYSAGTTPTTGAQVVYKLATPTTYALSAVQVVQMLAGVNNVWTDAAGTVSGEYYANTAMYVEKIVNAQKGMIAGVEAEMTASKNYSVGDLMVVGDALYKATAAISSGAALVIGTNIAQTTVAEQLIALANA